MTSGCVRGSTGAKNSWSCGCDAPTPLPAAYSSSIEGWKKETFMVMFGSADRTWNIEICRTGSAAPGIEQLLD